MAELYSYKAKNEQGGCIAGELLAHDAHAVAIYLRDKGFFVTGIKERKKNTIFLAWFSRVNRIELARFCQQLSFMLHGGVDLLQALNVMISQTEQRTLKEAMQDVYKCIQEGEALAQALARHHSVFPKLMVSMVEAGELAGVLDTVLSQLASYYEKEHRLQQQVKAALIYPVMVLSMAVGVIFLIIMYVLPLFIDFYEEMKMPLPLATRRLMIMTKWLETNGLWITIGIGVLGLVLVFMKRNKRTKVFAFSIFAAIPVVGDLWRKNMLVRLSRMLSILLAAGIPLLVAVEVVRNSIDNDSLADILLVVEKNIRAGNSFSSQFTLGNVFTPMFIQMIQVGEQTGELDVVLGQLAQWLERDVQHGAECCSRALEPLLITVTAGIVGTVMVLLVLPLFTTIADLSQSL